jgi:hypothetical protein
VPLTSATTPRIEKILHRSSPRPRHSLLQAALVPQVRKLQRQCDVGERYSSFTLFEDHKFAPYSELADNKQ